MNKRIAMSAMSIFGALAIMGGATYAAFSDSASVTGNTFASGVAGLQVAPDVSGAPGGFLDSITGPTFNDVIPGQTKTYFFWLKNGSTSTLNLNLAADVTAISAAADIDQEMDNSLLISWTCDTDNNNSLDNNSATTGESPRAFLDGGTASIGTIASGDEMFCKMTGTLPLDAPAGAAGETMSFDVVYGGVQASPSPSATP
jgi:predicted ribosomally synthesized peptide with SipW-like signal peptide